MRLQEMLVFMLCMKWAYLLLLIRLENTQTKYVNNTPYDAFTMSLKFMCIFS